MPQSRPGHGSGGGSSSSRLPLLGAPARLWKEDIPSLTKNPLFYFLHVLMKECPEGFSVSVMKLFRAYQDVAVIHLFSGL